ncbi:hypothetical protein HHK36_027555 [Tetracentron sinense]|uniref:Protein kinase domain-containing protein n=1 Tax=Tetracentron sinense TaxID=13715 RepID=A0A834YJC8_TETSI|nr:hypothetical protein HHK36_027555 [Tetracentron sinense]
MLSRAFNARKTRRSPKDGEGCSRSLSFHEDDDWIAGLMDDLPLSFCDRRRGGESLPTLREVLLSSVQVMGENGLGISEKVVLLDGAVYAAKRFRKVTVRSAEFGRRVERLAHVSRRSEYLVPITAYLYAKRIKLVLSDYYPMGSLADLLVGGRELDHTPLDCDQRLTIILHVARAISFIHNQSPPQEKHLQMNVHGNIKASNILIKTDFSACVSDYGVVQLAEPEVFGIWQRKPPPETVNSGEILTQKCDIYNFGVIVLDILGGPKEPFRISSILEEKEKIKEGVIEFFEFSVKGRERKKALKVLDIALACTNRTKQGAYELDLYLSNKHEELLAKTLDPGSYKKKISMVIVDGFAVEITDDQANLLRSAKGVRVVEKNQEIG